MTAARGDDGVSVTLLDVSEKEGDALFASKTPMATMKALLRSKGISLNEDTAPLKPCTCVDPSEPCQSTRWECEGIREGEK